MSDLRGNSVAAEEHRLVDDRKAARGLGRVVVALFWVAGAATFVVALWQLFSDHADPIGPKLTTLFTGVRRANRGKRESGRTGSGGKAGRRRMRGWRGVR